MVKNVLLEKKESQKQKVTAEVNEIEGWLQRNGAAWEVGFWVDTGWSIVEKGIREGNEEDD